MKKNRDHLITIFIVALVLRAICFILIPGYTEGDEWYVISSIFILTPQGYGYWRDIPGRGLFWKSWVMPFYSYFQSLIMLVVGPDFFWVRFITAGLFIILGGISCLLVYKLAKRLGGNNRFSLTVAWIMAVMPSQCMWSTRLHPHSFLNFWYLLLAFLVIYEIKKPSLTAAFLQGIVLGVATLTRGEAALMWVPIFLWWMIRERSAFVFKKMALLMAGFFLTMSPWIIRNWELQHTFMITANNAGENIYFAHNPAYSTEDPFATQQKFPVDMAEEFKKLHTEQEAANLFTKVGVGYIRSHPKKFISTVSYHLWHYWRPYLTPRWVSWPKNILYILTSTPFLILFFIGVGLLKSIRSGWFFMAMFVFWNCLAHLPFYIVIRFRENVFPFILLVAMFGFVSLFRNFSSRYDLSVNDQ